MEEAQDESKKAITIPGGMVSLAEAKAEHNAEVGQLKAENAAQKERADANEARLAEMQRRLDDITQAQPAPPPSDNRSSSSMNVDGGAHGGAHGGAPPPAPPPGGVDPSAKSQETADSQWQERWQEQFSKLRINDEAIESPLRDMHKQANLQMNRLIVRAPDGTLCVVENITEAPCKPMQVRRGVFNPQTQKFVPTQTKPSPVALHTHTYITSIPWRNIEISENSACWYVDAVKALKQQETDAKQAQQGAEAQEQFEKMLAGGSSSKTSGGSSNRGSSGRGSSGRGSRRR